MNEKRARNISDQVRKQRYKWLEGFCKDLSKARDTAEELAALFSGEEKAKLETQFHQLNSMVESWPQRTLTSV